MRSNPPNPASSFNVGSTYSVTAVDRAVNLDHPQDPESDPPDHPFNSDPLYRSGLSCTSCLKGPSSHPPFVALPASTPAQMGTAVTLNPSLDAALSYASRFGWHVLPLHTPTETGCSCGNLDCPAIGKHPQNGHGCLEATTDPDIIRSWFAGDAVNIGIATGEKSGLVVLDVDSEEGLSIIGSLPHTLSVRTGRGWQFYFLHPGVKTGNRAGLLPGVDLRGDGGYVCAPPSRHANGRVYTWITPPETPLAPLPSRFLSAPASPSPVSNAAGIEKGRRNDALFRLARSLHAKGCSEETIAESVRTENRTNCNPSLDEREVSKIIRSAIVQPNSPSWIEAPETTDEPEEGPLQVPGSAMRGLGREFADLYSQQLEAPVSFFYFPWLTYFGANLGGTTLATELRPQPRMNTVLLAESDEKKTTGLKRADDFWKPLGGAATAYGVGSAEGLARVFKGSDGRVVLHFDELKAFVDKCRIDGSVLLQMVGSLFERNDYQNATRSGNVVVTNASLSIVSSCTRGTYESMFTPEFHSIGFHNRLFLVADSPTSRVPWPEEVSKDALESLRDRTKARIREVEDKIFALTPDAKARWSEWYRSLPRDLFTKRLDTYGLRLMLLLAASIPGQDVVDLGIVEAVLELLEYQRAVRVACDPVDAANPWAAMEETLMRKLAAGPLSRRNLWRKAHGERAGERIFSAALRNLIDAGRIVAPQKTSRGSEIYRLPESGS